MNLGEVFLGLASIALGYRSLSNGAARLSNGLNSGGGGGRIPTVRVPRALTRSMPPVVKQGKRVPTRAGQMGVSLREVRSLGDRLSVIIDKAHQGKLDPVIIGWARREVSKKDARGQWVTPEKDTEAEAFAIFRGLRRDIRYTSDVRGVDTYANPRKTLETRAGDCLPGDTLLATPRGLVPIKDVKVGDTIHDGLGWTRITNWWNKGEQEVLSFELNNRSFLRCTGGHRVFRITRKNGEHVEQRAEDLQVGDLLLQPRDFAAGVETLTPGHATILGAYLAEGWWDDSKGVFCIAGVPNSKGLRERVLEAARSLGITDVYEHPRYLAFRRDHAWLVAGCGAGAAQKRLPHLNFSRPTVDLIVTAMEMGDGGIQGGLNMTYSTASATLAHQYRVLKRMQGFSTLMRCLSPEEHGGAGMLPVWRLIVRTEHTRKPWAKVRSVESLGTQCTYDIETESHRIYLPGADIIVHNCDEYSAVGAAALMAVGIPVRFEVIQTTKSSTPDHIFIQAGVPKEAPTKWVSLDASVNMPPGWRAPDSMIQKRWLFETE